MHLGSYLSPLDQTTGNENEQKKNSWLIIVSAGQKTDPIFIQKLQTVNKCQQLTIV